MLAADGELQLWGEEDRSNQPWSVHDGQFFAEHVRDGNPTAPMERRLVDSDQLQAWVDSCTDFLSKPIDPARLTGFVRKFVEGGQA